MFCAKYAWGLRRACDSHRSGLYSLDVDMADERPTIFAKVQLLLGQADAPGPLYPPSVALQPSTRRNTLNMLPCTRFRKPIGPGSALLPVAISTTHDISHLGDPNSGCLLPLTHCLCAVSESYLTYICPFCAVFHIRSRGYLFYTTGHNVLQRYPLFLPSSHVIPIVYSIYILSCNAASLHKQDGVPSTHLRGSALQPNPLI